MRHFLLYLLLITYGNAMVKPVMPYLVDAFSHLLNYEGHMATAHAHGGGKMHVHDEIQALEKYSQEKNHRAPVKNQKEQKEHKDQIQQDDFASVGQFSNDIQHHSFYNCKLIQIYPNNFFPPPDQLSVLVI
jgi:hypothetical protein